MRREHDGAVPRTLTTDFFAFTTTVDEASAGSGGATSRVGVRVRPPKTLGKPLVSMVSCRALESAWAPEGMSLSMPPSSALLRTSRLSHGNDDEPSGTAT